MYVVGKTSALELASSQDYVAAVVVAAACAVRGPQLRPKWIDHGHATRARASRQQQQQPAGRRCSGLNTKRIPVLLIKCDTLNWKKCTMCTSYTYKNVVAGSYNNVVLVVFYLNEAPAEELI